MRRAKSKTNGASVQRTDRQVRAVELRIASYSYREIAAEMGIDVKTAHDLVSSSLRDSVERRNERSDELRVIEVERLDGMLRRLYPLATAAYPDMAAVDRVLRISKRRCEIMGLDAPESVELSGKDGGPVQIQSMTDVVRAAMRARAEKEKGR
jgi:hypothetical protein